MKNKEHLKIAICQINPTVGDLRGNSRKIVEFYRKAVKEHAPELVVFPECALTGYPPEDLLLKESFLLAAEKTLKVVARLIGSTQVVLGTVWRRREAIFNSAVGLKEGEIRFIYRKHILPNYGVFDEKRYFTPGNDPGIFQVNGIPIGISICEDIWEEDPDLSPCFKQAKRGARILVNISASPYQAGKFDMRCQLLKRRVRQTKLPILYANMVGGQDELVYDGRSMAMDANGHLRVLAKSFEEDIRLVHLELAKGDGSAIRKDEADIPSGVSEIYQALVLGTRDYINKNGFRSAVVGLSGGIDSALVACIAADAVGPGRVIGVTMPSRYSSSGTRSDAARLAKNLGIRFLKIPIHRIQKAFLRELAPQFKGRPPDITEENIQPRIRATLLMALSNKFGHLVLATGNKSEISVGYCTLYGDAAGGFAVLKDAPKTVVYELARYVNKKSRPAIIPHSTLLRPPTAELKFNQKDQDTLPPYPVLDGIINGYVEEDAGYRELLREGFNRRTLKKVIRMIDANEYKRRQSPLGVKLTPKSFGRDRRMPITNKFSEWNGK